MAGRFHRIGGIGLCRRGLAHAFVVPSEAVILCLPGDLGSLLHERRW